MVAFPPAKGDGNLGVCQIVVDSKYPVNNVEVRINRYVFETFRVGPYQPLRYNTSCNVRTLPGTEVNKGFWITSEFPVSVKVFNEVFGTYGDVALAQPVTAQANDYYLITETTEGEGDCGFDANRTFSYYVVMAQETQTLVTITNPDGSVQDPVRLEPYETYTVVQTFADRNLGFTGTHLYCSKPLSVITGNACYTNGDPGVASPIMDYVPPAAQYGLDYIVPPMPTLYGEDQVYVVTVVAAVRLTVDITGEADTIQLEELESISRTFSAGSFTVVRCSQPCAVGITLSNEGPSFMSYLPPTSEYNREVYFTEPQPNTLNVVEYNILLVTLSNNFDNFFINNISIGGLGWECALDLELAFCYVPFSLNLNKPYNLTSLTEEDRFSALNYGGIEDVDLNVIGRGFGHQLSFYGNKLYFMFKFKKW